MEIVVIGAVLAGFLFIWNRYRNRAGGAALHLPRVSMSFGNRCKWRAKNARSASKQSGLLMEFQCATCGVTAYSTEKNGPKQCKKGLDGSKL